MPTLQNARHEKFAQALAAGSNADEAYKAAGYAANRGNAARLKANDDVQKRLDELLSTAAEGVQITVETLTRMYLDDRAFAYRSGAPAAAVRAADSLAKLHGFWIDRADVKVEQSSLADVLDTLKARRAGVPCRAS